MSYTQGTVRVASLLSTLESAITAPLGETLPSNEASVTLTGSQNAVQLTMPSVGTGLNPSGWNIYKGTVAGGETLLVNIPGNQTTFIDDGSLTVGTTTVPVTSTGNLYSLPSTLSGTITATALNSSFVSQQFTTSNAYIGVAYNQILSQPFFANHELLSEIDLPLDVNGGPTGNIIVQIFANAYENTTNVTGDYNVPASTTTPLGSATVAITNMNHVKTSGLYTKFIFSTPVTLTVGTLYHIVVSLSNSADTLASTNYVVCAYLSYSAGNTAVCPAINVAWQTSSLTTINWTSINANNLSSLNYIIYGTGSLATQTYYYKITATTGWSPVFTQSIFGPATNNLYTSNIYYSSGSNANENIFIAQTYNGNTNNSLQHSVLEHYDNQTHVLLNQTSAFATNGLGIAGTSYYNNIISRTATYYSGTESNTVNVTFRVHLFADHMAISLVGDSTLTGFQEYVVFLGKVSSLSSTDKCYVISNVSTYDISSWWLVLRDYANAVGQNIIPLFPVQSNVANGIFDGFPYLNKFTNNYDAITMGLLDAGGAGYRGNVPDMILFPSASSNVINNHDQFTFNGQTYQYYIPTNLGDFSWENAGTATGRAQNVYYPAFRIA